MRLRESCANGDGDHKCVWGVSLQRMWDYLCWRSLLVIRMFPGVEPRLREEQSCNGCIVGQTCR